VSWNGYGSDVMKSALQKYIRRGILDKALYSAGELDLFKEAKEDRAEAIRSNFIHRLMIIYMEDVENITLLPELETLFTNVLEERKKVSRNTLQEEKWISRIVYLLTLSPKARICSHIRSIFSVKYRPVLSKYPSLQNLVAGIDTSGDKYSLLRDSLKSKSITSIYYAFQIDSSNEKIGNRKAVWFIFDQLEQYYSYTAIFRKWYKNELSNVKEGFLCWLTPMLVYLGVIKGTTPEETPYLENWDRNRRGEVIEIEDFVVDRHTKKGRNKGVVEFAEKGALVENEASFVNPIWKAFYEDTKRYEEGLPLKGYKINRMEVEESDEEEKKEIDSSTPVYEKNKRETERYEFLVRTQLTTSSSKMDVYFARRNGKLVVVKGPYEDKSSIEVLERNTAWKKQNGILYLPFVVEELIPDRWPEGIPLGARNKVDRSKPCWFIILDSLIYDIKTKKHFSKVWPETEVVDWEKIDLHFDYKKNPTEQELTDYVHGILYRYVRGVSDLADRNFLKSQGRVISIDEDIENRKVDLYTELKKNKAEFIRNWISDNYISLGIENWVALDSIELKRLQFIKSKENCLSLFKGN
jgi:hypothetical protein